MKTKIASHEHAAFLRDTFADDQALALIGLGKNAGKTTVLNALVHAHREADRSLVLTSVGYDGESYDLVAGHQKPLVYLFPGMSVVTAQQFLKQASVDPEIVACFDGDSLFGPPVYAKAKQAGFVVIAGPSSLHDLIVIRSRVRAEEPASLFVVDGALGRKRGATADYADASILCVGTAFGAPYELAEQVEHALYAMTLPLAEADEGTRIFGALTDRVAADLMTSSDAKKGPLVIDDRASCFISDRMRRALARQGVEVKARQGASVRALVLNPRLAGGQLAPIEPYVASISQKTDLPLLVLDAEPAIGKAI